MLVKVEGRVILRTDDNRYLATIESGVLGRVECVIRDSRDNGIEDRFSTPAPDVSFSQVIAEAEHRLHVLDPAVS